jgi:hypothetical protein
MNRHIGLAARCESPLSKNRYFLNSVLLRCHRKARIAALTKNEKSKNTNMTIRSAAKYIVVEKISLNDSRLVVNPACIAGVRISHPNLDCLRKPQPVLCISLPLRGISQHFHISLCIYADDKPVVQHIPSQRNKKKRAAHKKMSL